MAYLKFDMILFKLYFVTNIGCGCSTKAMHDLKKSDGMARDGEQIYIKEYICVRESFCTYIFVVLNVFVLICI